MEEEQEQQKQLHSSVVDGIARLEDRDYREERHQLIVHGFDKPPIDRQSWEHLVTFLDGDSHEVTELQLEFVRLPHPSDGGVQVLREFFARSDMTPTKVTLRRCTFGSQDDTLQLLAAFHTNRTVMDLEINHTRNLESAALGACLANLMQNMPQLQRLDCSWLRVEGFRAFHPALEANRTLRELNLSYSRIGDDGIHLLADALVGNTTMDKLDIGYNLITSNGLADITRLLQSTQLEMITLPGNEGVCDNIDATQRFARILSRHELLKELNLGDCRLGGSAIRLLVDALVGNTIMEALCICANDITSNGLADITHLLESTRLKKIDLSGNRGIFNDKVATQHFVSTLQCKKSSVQELPGIDEYDFPNNITAATHFSAIKNCLVRNKNLNHVTLLLAPPQAQQQQPPPLPPPPAISTSTTMMLKTCHKAIVKFAKVPNNAGASALFKLFTARPQLLEKRLKRPAAAAAVAANAADATATVSGAAILPQQASVYDDTAKKRGGNQQKRQRL